VENASIEEFFMTDKRRIFDDSFKLDVIGRRLQAQVLSSWRWKWPSRATF